MSTTTFFLLTYVHIFHKLQTVAPSSLTKQIGFQRFLFSFCLSEASSVAVETMVARFKHLLTDPGRYSFVGTGKLAPAISFHHVFP